MSQFTKSDPRHHIAVLLNPAAIQNSTWPWRTSVRIRIRRRDFGFLRRTFQANHPGTQSPYREGNPVEVGFPVGLVEQMTTIAIPRLIKGNRTVAGSQEQSSEDYME